VKGGRASPDFVDAPAARVRWTGFARFRERPSGVSGGRALPGLVIAARSPAAGVHPNPAQPVTSLAAGVHQLQRSWSTKSRRSRSTPLRRRRFTFTISCLQKNWRVACSGEVDFIRVLAAVEAKPASPVLAQRSQPRLQLRALLVGLGVARKQARPKTRNFTMAFQVEELSIQLIEVLVPLMPRIKQRDKALEDQLRRAASSIGLNCAEAALSDPGNKRARLFTAAGSANEAKHALRQAIAWRLVTVGEAETSMRLLRRIVAILWRMTRG
jgi:four helix bundle protein